EDPRVSVISQPVTLPCGLVLDNRIVKAAMEPCLANKGRPSKQHITLHSKWSQGKFGLIISENVQVSAKYLSTPHDVFILPEDEDNIPKTWIDWAEASKIPTLIQLSHAGRQSCRGLGRWVWENSVGPSPLRMTIGNRPIDRLTSWMLFNEVEELTKDDIRSLVETFASSANFVYKAGFQGIQLHCSHGYLLSQFLSPKTNLRTDEYGGTPLNRMRFIFDIISAVRRKLPKSFCLSVKLNSGDYNNVKMIVEHGGVDLIEISGGTYENVAFMNEPGEVCTSSKTPNGSRGAFFVEFSSRARQVARSSSEEFKKSCPLIITTGGFRSRKVIAEAISSGKTDAVALGRPACLDPFVASKILDSEMEDYTFLDPYIPGSELWKTLMPVQL
ncbi:hypothetical protein BY996DRAFT_8444693, partial [Phakopsora pachyrhizi]